MPAISDSHVERQILQSASVLIDLARLRTASGTHAAALRSSIYGCLRPRLSVLPGRPAAECFVQDLAAAPAAAGQR
jgi:hypothetical protein